MSYDDWLTPQIPAEHVAQIDAVIATIRDTVQVPIRDLKEALQQGESPEHLFIRCQMVTHSDVHRAIETENGCEFLGQTIAHLMVRVAKMELVIDARN